MDKVDHGAGQSCVRMVPVERLLELREVRDIMFSWMPASFSYRMKRVTWKSPYALMVSESHYNRKSTSDMTITALREQNRCKETGRQKTVVMATVYWTLYVGSASG